MKLLGLTLGLALASGALAQNFGPAVIDRSNVDLAHEITFISGVHASPMAGENSEWQLWASGTGDVALQMWRPVAGGFELVGQNLVTVTTLGLNSIAINSGRIQVQAGDVIGFRYNQTTFGTRVIDFDSGVGGQYRWTNWPDPGTNVGIGGVLLDTNLIGQNEGREYSLAATVVPEPATMTVLGLAAVAAWRRPRK